MNAKKNQLYAEHMCTDGKDLWFAQADMNLLYRIDIKIKSIKKIYVIPYVEHIYAVYSSIQYYRGKIWLIPSSACRFVVFDIVNESFESIDLTIYDNWDVYWRYFNSYIYNDSLYCLPFNANNLTRVDLETKEMQNVANHSLQFNDGKTATVWGTADIGNGRFAMSALGINGIIIYDTGKEEMYRLFVDEFDGQQKLALESDGKYLYVYETNTGILKKMDLSTEKEVLKTSCIEPVTQNREVMATILFNKYIIIDFQYSPEYVIYDKDLVVIRQGKTGELGTGWWEGACYHGIWSDIHDNMAVYFNNCTNDLTIFSKDIQSPIDSFELSIDDSWKEEYKNYIDKEDILYENNNWELKDFL